MQEKLGNFMKINNGQLLSLLFDEPKLVEALNQSIPYISIFKEKTILNLRCLEISSLSSLLKFRSELTNKLVPFLGYEIHLECMQHAIGDAHMVAIAERLSENLEETEKFLSLETLAKATSTSPIEVKKLLAKAKEVIHPQEDGSEMITENAFDSVVLQWAKSFKENGAINDANSNTLRTEKIKERKPITKVLTSELTNEDIIKVRTGKTVGCPNLTSKGIDTTLTNFFGKVLLSDTSLVDAVSAFIEGTGEYGQALRKKLITGYKKFTKDPDLKEIENKLIEGARTYLEGLAAPSTQD